MKEIMKLSTSTTVVLGSVAVASFSFAAAQHYYKRAVELKADNVELLKKTVAIVNTVDTRDVPEEILVDIQFRCMALLTEAESKE